LKTQNSGLISTRANPADLSKDHKKLQRSLDETVHKDQVSSTNRERDL